jgi:hypothetical protein
MFRSYIQITLKVGEESITSAVASSLNVGDRKTERSRDPLKCKLRIQTWREEDIACDCNTFEPKHHVTDITLEAYQYHVR